MKHYVVYCHGFGVDKTGRGLITDIAGAMPEAEHVLIDFNEVDEVHKTLLINPLSIQVERLQEKLAALDTDGHVVDIVAHSQGCVVAALAKPRGIRRIICLAPPDGLDVMRVDRIFGSLPGSHIDFTGESRVPLPSGTTLVIPKEYWPGTSLDVIGLYNHLPDLAERVLFYTASDDEMLSISNFNSLDERIQLAELAGNHNFFGTVRPELVRVVKEVIIH